MGTANVLRTVGARAGAITFALDVARGRGRRHRTPIRGGPGRTGGCGARRVHRTFMAGVRPVPRWEGGRHGVRGLLMVSPEAAAWATAGGIGALALSRTMSVGSLTATVTATFGAGLESTRRHDAVPFVFTALVSTLVVVRHAANIRRIARGEEPQLSTRLFGGRH